MNKKVVIIGGVLILCLGAYFYFKPKKTGTTGTGTSGSGTSGDVTTGSGTTGTGTTSVPTTGTTLSTPAEVEDMSKKIAEARSLATQISDLRNKRSSTMAMSLNDFGRETGHLTNGFGAESALKFFKEQEIKSLEAQMKNLDEQLGKLGFMEVNGSITKIV